MQHKVEDVPIYYVDMEVQVKPVQKLISCYFSITPSYSLPPSKSLQNLYHSETLDNMPDVYLMKMASMQHLEVTEDAVPTIPH
eukprot:CAMPEP_0201285940 /NCGR_PEP_ID=MMETSP1317-20130820/114053_1 /ASSEMBLY_ACC=CAM_ASM_000770 /TAXON_ID=187299 /ORGANISM="Undescribed Undescribed, Strain Undescribed" /LENGTH=82 /DNA_ID=CAMNT_0047612193 /DNA_START=406 /DNA_END=654 /DNA_ORIENTATION=-